MTVEHLNRGAVIGAHKMLISEKNSITAICMSHVIIYSIERTVFTRLVSRDPALMLKLIELQDVLIEKEENDHILDFVQIKQVIELPTGKKLIGDEAARASKLSLKLKNVIL